MFYNFSGYGLFHKYGLRVCSQTQYDAVEQERDRSVHGECEVYESTIKIRPYFYKFLYGYSFYCYPHFPDTSLGGGVG